MVGSLGGSSYSPLVKKRGSSKVLPCSTVIHSTVEDQIHIYSLFADGVLNLKKVVLLSSLRHQGRRYRIDSYFTMVLLKPKIGDHSHLSKIDILEFSSEDSLLPSTELRQQRFGPTRKRSNAFLRILHVLSKHSAP
jgi:hypothetical protein